MAMGVAFQVQDLSFQYPSSTEETIKGITFDVLEGEIFGLLGPSGAGKSTTQKILVKLLEDYRGSIAYFGRDLKTMAARFTRRLVSGLKCPFIFKLTALENLRFFSGFYKDTANIQELMRGWASGSTVI